MEFVARITKDGGIDLGERNGAHFKQWRRDNPGALIKITPVLPESNKQRRFLEGAVIPLVTYYQDGLNHRDVGDRAKVREWLKSEFNSEWVRFGGRNHRIAKSTRGRDALNKFLEDVVGWLQDNYAPPTEALDPNHFKLWRDTVMDGPDNYIDWMIEQKLLK